MKIKPYHIAWIACLLAVAGFGIILRGAALLPSSPPQDAGVAGVAIGGPFVLTDHNGHKVTEHSWPNQYLLVYFGFTHCPDICPIGLNKMTEALNSLPPSQAERIQGLFITVDPERDDAKTLKEYVTLFHKDLIGLTGTPEEIEHVKKMYRVYAQKSGTGDDYMVNHSGFMYLMGPDGKNLVIYPHEDTADAIAASLKDKVKRTD